MEPPPINPYQSPQFADRRAGELPEDLQTIAELQERVRKLEEQLKKNWFWGPSWKRALAVLGYFIIGYFVLAVFCYAIAALVMGLLYVTGAIEFFA